MSATISPSRTYMIGIYDPISPDEIHFEKVVLPESSGNTIKNAKQYYLLGHMEEIETIRITACVSIEEYLSATNREFIEEEKEDIETTLKMLYEWNAKQEIPFESYNMALTALLDQVALMYNFDRRFTKLREVALEILEIE